MNDILATGLDKYLDGLTISLSVLYNPSLQFGCLKNTAEVTLGRVRTLMPERRTNSVWEIPEKTIVSSAASISTIVFDTATSRSSFVARSTSGKTSTGTNLPAE